MGTMVSKAISLLDCTLRDGSYQVGFGFTAPQTSSLVRRLESTGVDLIEVGHGLGLGAPASGRVNSAESDETYIRAAKEAARHAKIGVFAMPAFATLDDLSRAGDLGIDFLRFGVDAARFLQAEPFIRHASRLGVHVTTFLMKTYTLGLDAFAEDAKQLVDWGSHAVAIVDSAGGMTPPMVRGYVGIALERTGLPVAFHGHNNLQLAVGNAIAAAEAGATILDASLKGLGRSAGNAQIEALAIALSRCGFVTNCDALALAHLADEFIAELGLWRRPAPSNPDRDVAASRTGIDTADLLQGLTFVHSGMQPMIERVAADMNIAAGHLIIAIGEVSRGLDLDETTVRSIAMRLRGHS